MVTKVSKTLSSSDEESFFREPLTQRESPAGSRSEKSTFTTEELTPDDEIFTLQCPENFNKEDLCQENIDFSQFRPTVTSGNELYHLEFINSGKNSITLAIPKKKHDSALVNLPLKGHIVIKKVVGVTDGESAVEDQDIHDEHTVAFPKIKIRHPLLGSEWQSHIDLVSEKIKTKKSLVKDKSLQRKKDKKLKLKLKEDSGDDIVPKKKKKYHT